MTADSFVRPARAADAAGLARIQVECWREQYSGLVPHAVLAELTGPEAEDRFRSQWEAAADRPPTARHRVLVAVETREPRQRVLAGFASCGPATDADRWPATDAELYELDVAPGLTGRGHGSRLLNAVADTVSEDGFHTLCAWTLESGASVRPFLEATGWRADGARADLDMGTKVPMIRLHVAIAGTGE